MPAAVAKLRPLSAPLALTALVAGSAVFRALDARAIAVPWIVDELVYGLLGQALYRSGELEVLGGPTPFYSLLYPALVGLPLGLDDLERGYALLRPLQALVVSLTAVPVYLWGRTLMARRWALLAAALTLLLPGLAYAGLIMSEVLYLPVGVLAAWTLSRALVRPTLAAQALVVLTLGAAVATRLQALVLVPVLLSAICLKALLDRSLQTPRRLVPLLAGLAALTLAWAGWQLRGGGPWSKLLGGYQSVGEADYAAGAAARYVLYHAGHTLLFTGIVPACALALLVVAAVRRVDPSEPARAFLAVALATVAWLVVEVGVFASHYVRRLAERDLLSLAPLLFLALALWLDRGAPRPRLVTGIVALGAAALVLSVPLERLVDEYAAPDAFTLIPLHRLAVERPGLDLELVVRGAAAAVLALFALLPRRLTLVLPALLALGLGVASVQAGDEIVARAAKNQAQLVGPERRWIDRRIEAGAAYLYDGEAYWPAVWEQVFWNRRLERVYTLRGSSVPGPLPQVTVSPRPDGRLASASPPYVVASTAFSFRGERLAETVQEGINQRGLVLWRVDQPLRVWTRTTGLAANGDVSTAARLTVYGCEPGVLRLTLLPKAATQVELARNGSHLRTLFFEPGAPPWSGELEAQPRNGVCSFDVVPNSLLGTTVFEFVPR